ncbi:MAG TPA: hypothetical protein VHO84_12175 [Syntrophorhabdaceae bacterium]|nr:hypothetical protein [Syntrophorhabdaceae bacterium]
MNMAISGSRNCCSTSAVNNSVTSYGKGSKSNEETNGNGNDAIQVSTRGRLLASSLLEDLILPTKENVSRLSAELSVDLDKFLDESGIKSQPPIELSVDWNSGNIQVKGDRVDAEKIQNLINGDEGMKKQIRDLAAIASHVAGIEDSMQFQKEYLASDNPESIVAKYSYLFSSNHRSHSISLLFEGDSVQVMSDGKQLVSS